MSDDRHMDWFEENQRYLHAALDAVRAALDRRAASTSGSDATVDVQAALDRAAKNISDIPALENLVTTFGLSPFERNVLLLCAGVELDPAFADCCAAVHGEPGRRYPTFGLALNLFSDAHWSSLTPGAPLRYHLLVELTGSGGLTEKRLHIDERILHYLTGIQHLDQRLEGYLRPVAASGPLLPSHRELAHQIAAAWSGWDLRTSAFPIIHLQGRDLESMRTIARIACDDINLMLYEILGQHIPPDPRELESLIRLWQREAVLSSGALLVTCAFDETVDAGRTGAIQGLIDTIRMPLIVAGELPGSCQSRSPVVLEVKPPMAHERRELWKQSLGSAVSKLDGGLDTIVHQFQLGASTISAVAMEVLARQPRDDGDENPEAGRLCRAINESCRVRARSGLSRLAQRLEPVADWTDIVLPAPRLSLLREIAIQVRQRMKVYEQWGFARKHSRGLGISALFAGPSGTGKTMAAEVLANELGLDLFRIDLSRVVSKYIGETEKNLRRVFDAAEEGSAILLFDEADALFGKRSEVKDSHDRYANIEISYLLQRMEAYHGLAILTTNMKSALDDAFLRRIRFIIEFPFPDVQSRREIWRRVFPEETPLEELNLDSLSQLNIAGGNIFNIAMHAAFHAAEEGRAVGMSHLLSAAKTEYGKLKKTLSQREVQGWL